MKLSCVEMMLGDLPVERKFETVKRAGFDGIDLAGDLVHDRIAQINQLKQETKLEVPTVYGRLRMPLLAKTIEERSKTMELLRGRLRDASAVGADNLILVPIFGDARIEVERGHGKKEIELALLMVLLDELAEEAEASRVTIVLEPLNRQQTHLLVSPTETAKLTRELGNKFVATMADTYHMDLEGQDAVAEVENLGDQLKLVHLSDRDRKLPGQGGLDFKPVLSKLELLGYAGYCGFECSGPFDADQLAESVRWVHSQV